MSSHREAPEISKDPVADNTDVYAFVSPDRPDTVTLIANFIPLQKPDGGPNFYEFGDDVTYEIKVANRGTGYADIRYQFRFKTQIRNTETFLYNTGPINNITDSTWNRPQYYSVTRIRDGKTQVIASGLRTPPVNIGPRSTPDYPKLAAQAVHTSGGRKIFAGQRADAFKVDLGSIFDLGGLRPFNDKHAYKLPIMDGINSVDTYNVHTIALQVPISEVTRHRRRPTDYRRDESVIGVWATANRRKSRIIDSKTGKVVGTGNWQQVSRLGNPLFNEVIVPMAEKDLWNHLLPHDDARFAKYVNHPELAGLLPALYPNVFPNLKAYTKPRADLNAILLTGIPRGVIPGFQNYTGPRESDVLRLNVAIPPSADPKPLGILDGDLAGFPNGRRVTDDVVTVELRAIAGATIKLVDPSYEPDPAASAVTDGTQDNASANASTTDTFPYLGNPGGGYQTRPGDTAVSGTGGPS